MTKMCGYLNSYLFLIITQRYGAFSWYDDGVYKCRWGIYNCVAAKNEVRFFLCWLNGWMK